MAIPSSGEIKMGGSGTNSIAQVKAGTDTGTPSAVQNVSLRGLSVDGVNDFEYVGGAATDIAVAGSSPDQVAPHAMSEFHGYVQLADTTSANYFFADNQDEVSQGSVTAESYVRVEAYYSDFTYNSIYVVADVNAVGGLYQEEVWSPNGGTTQYNVTGSNPLPSPVYRIDGIGSLGYTVRYSASNFTGDASTDFDFDTQYGSLSSLTTSAQSLYVLTASPNSRRGLETRLTVTSGDGDETAASGTCQIQLIFEKSGSTTFTYTFTVSLQAEAVSLGGQ